MSNAEIEKYIKALERQVAERKEQELEVSKSYRYEDYILIERKDGKKFKLPTHVNVQPFPIVVAGKLPEAETITSGVAHG